MNSKTTYKTIYRKGSDVPTDIARYDGQIKFGADVEVERDFHGTSISVRAISHGNLFDIQMVISDGDIKYVKYCSMTYIGFSSQLTTKWRTKNEYY